MMGAHNDSKYKEYDDCKIIRRHGKIKCVKDSKGASDD